MSHDDDLPNMLERLKEAEAAWWDFVRARERMNAARPDLEATKAERALYDERYQADHEAEREFRSQAHRLFSDDAIITRTIAALSEHNG